MNIGHWRDWDRAIITDGHVRHSSKPFYIVIEI
jgi:hypothetical protein